ncbi:DUF72 domain-containing protein [Mariniflexile ostreae]|uniref:DUF72 domain-containing protein n=1 Tax=Mariniflexile ostreae TaxID=1520892 RepID=A0ABV5FE28_9FLAO
MKFGSVKTPQHMDLSLPPDHRGTKKVLANLKDENLDNKALKIYVGRAKWNRTDLKGFYPKGTKDELAYYASQFNALEFNAPFYRIFSAEQFALWHDKTPRGFKFFPKLNQEISHWRRLNNTKAVVDHYLYNASNLKDKLGTVFLQMHANFAPKDFDSVVRFIEEWPKAIPLAVEFRHGDWFQDEAVSKDLYQLFEAHHIANGIVDTLGRRDLLHMRLTNSTAFVRFVGANHPSDFTRLDTWIDRLNHWKLQGIKEIDFFVHQHIESESPLLSAYFIKKLNQTLGSNLKIPNENVQETLF